MRYAVEYWKDDDVDIGLRPYWRRVGLVMCGAGLLCEDCAADPEHLDNCDYEHEIVPESMTSSRTINRGVSIDRTSQVNYDG